MNKHIDCHSHILYGIDDGAKRIEESIDLLKRLERLGFTDVILTPHYRIDYHANNEIKRKRFEVLKQRVEEERIPIHLYLANEVAISSNILELIEQEEIMLYHNYLFLELPFTNKIQHLERLIYSLQEKNINIILVHPERYEYLDKKDYQKLLDADVMFQLNDRSILGAYGNTAKKKAKYLLKNHMITFLGTDIHHTSQMTEKTFQKLEKKIIKIIGEKEYQKLSYDNLKKLLEQKI